MANDCADASLSVGGLSTYVDMYNATSDSWTRFPEGLGQAREYLSSSSLPSGLVFFAGGASSGAMKSYQPYRLRKMPLYCLVAPVTRPRSCPSAFCHCVLMMMFRAQRFVGDGLTLALLERDHSAHVDLYNEHFFSDTQTSLCPHCIAGSVILLNGFGCVKCSPGTFSNLSGSKTTVCTACQSGTYNPSSGQTSCTVCPAGTYNPSFGSISSSSCIACPAGTYNPSVGSISPSSCIACPAGTYTPSIGSVSSSLCTPCPSASLGDARFALTSVSLPCGLVFFAGGASTGMHNCLN
jgi:hypothetical protein